MNDDIGEEPASPWPAGAAGFNSKGEPLIPLRIGGSPYTAIREIAEVISGLDISLEEADALISTIGRAFKISLAVSAFFTDASEPSASVGNPGHVASDTALLTEAEFRNKKPLRWRDLKPLIASAAGHGQIEDTTIHRRLRDRYRAMVAAGQSVFPK